MFSRVIGILTAPNREWSVIARENDPHAKVFLGYILPLSLIPAIAAFIGYGLIGYSILGVHVGSMSWGIRHAIVQWVAMVGGLYITAFIVNFLAENFGARKNFDKAFSLVAYSYTPMLVGGIFFILPALSVLVFLAGLYGLYLLYIGMRPLMKVPTDKHTGYFVVSLIVTIVVSAVLSGVLGMFLLTRTVPLL